MENLIYVFYIEKNKICICFLIFVVKTVWNNQNISIEVLGYLKPVCDIRTEAIACGISNTKR